MTLALQLSTLLGFPIVRHCFKHPSTYFEGALFSMTMLASFMFHLCEIFGVELFLKELQWQRIDNVFTISSFELVILYLWGAVGPHDILLKLSTIFSTIIIQEKDPWNFNYSIAPLVAYIIVGAIYRAIKTKRVISYDKNRLLKAITLLMAGSYFFIAGLEE